MPKRSNPFDDNHFLLKMHIGEKEVNMGVNSAENMKKVYESTYKMLFNGSANNNSDHVNHNKALPNGYSNSSSCQKQNGGDLTNNQGGKFMMNTCCPSNQHVTCSFCEKTICVVCCRTCQCCQNKFCHLCSVLQYVSQDESAMCLSCM